jgi:multisubunit Na+/H+ antiporter MnhG subunit
MKAVRQLAIAIQLWIGIFGFYIGYLLISDPTGRRLDLSTSWLQHTPFSDYQLPGWIVTLGIGLLSLAAAVFTASRKQGYRSIMLIDACMVLLVNVTAYWLLSELFALQWVVIFLSMVLCLLVYVLSCPIPATAVNKLVATTGKQGKTHHFHKHRRRGQ